jgi:hypothetical protein
MTRTDLAELFAQYVRKQAEAQAEGLGHAAPSGEVEPYDAAPVQPVDPRLAWSDARVAAEMLAPRGKHTGTVPPEWSELVASREPAVALALSLGNFPQLVRDLLPLLRGGDVRALRPTAASEADAPVLIDWAMARRGEADTLMAAGVLRLAGCFKRAAELLARVPDGPWQALRDNERAALAWHSGKADEAAKLWQAQPESVPVLFNRGMAALFLGRAAEARPLLERAVAGLPEGDAWHHLGRLYLALTRA